MIAGEVPAPGEARDAGRSGEGAAASSSRTTSSSRPSRGRSRLPAGNLTANLIRNVWTFTIIFCGHFPEGAPCSPRRRREDESRGQWYYRQLHGSANMAGSSPSTSSPATSATRSSTTSSPTCPPTATPRSRRGPGDLRALRHPLQRRPAGQQFGSVVKKICRLALPDRKDRSRGAAEVDGDKSAEIREPVAA